MTMKREEALLHQALTAVRAGHELTARDLFLEVVEINPCNELAWIWLSGLLDDLGDCIYACERVLELNPRNDPIRQYLAQLQQKKQAQLAEQKQAAAQQVRQAVQRARAGQREAALNLIRDVALKQDPGVEGWRLVADLSSDTEEQIQALKRLVTLAPQDTKAREVLDRLSHLKHNPQELAAIYEEQGNLEKAIELYYAALGQQRFKKQWRSIESKIVQLKMRRGENIKHVSPITSIARLAAGPPVVYLFMLLIHVGINPLAQPEPLLWLDFLITAAGGLLIAFAVVRSHHQLWYVLFRDVSRKGPRTARLSVAAVGWTLVLLPFLHLFYAAFHRLIYLLPWG